MTAHTSPALYTGDDIIINGVVLNTISPDGCRWIITDLDGWWGLPDVDMPEDERSVYEDGSYTVTGRYTGRNITMAGFIVPGQESSTVPFTVAARNTLNRALHLVRQVGFLQVNESDEPKIAAVQTVGPSLTQFNGLNDVLEFNVQLRAVDPRKYSLLTDTVSTDLIVSTSGRTYNRTYTWTYGDETGDMATMTAVNRGSYDTNALIYIHGPVAVPGVEHVEKGVKLSFTQTLGIGQYIEINLFERTAFSESGVSVKNTMTLDSEWFTITPGTNTLRFLGAQTMTPRPPVTEAYNLIVNPGMIGTSGTVVTGIEGTKPAVAGIVTTPDTIAWQDTEHVGLSSNSLKVYWPTAGGLFPKSTLLPSESLYPDEPGN